MNVGRPSAPNAPSDAIGRQHPFLTRLYYVLIHPSIACGTHACMVFPAGHLVIVAPPVAD